MGSPTRLACLILLLWVCSNAEASDAFTGEITPLVDFGNNVHLAREVTTSLHVGGIARLEVGPTVSALVDLRVWLDPSTREGLRLRDNSSLLALRWRPEGWAEREGWSLSLFPFSSETLDLGYAEPVRWNRRHDLLAAGETRPKISAELRLEHARVTAHLASKFDPNAYLDTNGDQQSTLVHQGGFDVRLPFGFEAGAGGAWGPSRPSPRGRMVDADRKLLQRGATLRLAHRSEEEVAPIFDLGLYGGDPDFPRRLQAPNDLEHPAWYVSVEGTRLLLELDPSNQAGDTTLQTGNAVALEVRGHLSGVRVQALAWMRDIDFIQAEVPGYPVFKALPLHVDQQPERAFRVAADYRLRSIPLSPGIVTTVTWPAVMEMDGLLAGNEPLGGASPKGAVFYDPNVVSFYWRDLELAPTWELKVITRWDPHPSLTVLGEVGRYANPNGRLAPQTNPPLVGDERPEDAIWFGSVLAQARF